MYRNKKVVALYLLPVLILVTLFIYIPVVLNFFYSLFRWSAFSIDKVWIGFGNYTRLFTDETFWVALKNNAWYAIISVIFQVFVSLVLAAMLEQKWMRRFSSFFRTVYFVPSVISMTVVALLWQMMLNPNIGVVNNVMKTVGLGGFAADWLGNSKTAIFAVIAVSQWQYIGYTLLLFIIAIQKIPDDYYEAAMIDGANSIQTFFAITVPNCKEMIMLNLTVTIIGAFKVFDEVYIMTGGGPGRSSEVLGTYLYRSAFRNDQMGFASAIASIIFIITFVLSIVQIRMYDIDNTHQSEGGV